MIIKGVTDEDFVNYKKPSMYISMARCSFKCDIECGMNCCQNSILSQSPDIDMSPNHLIERYLRNPITNAIVFAGLEPMDQFDDVIHFIDILRCEYKCGDDVVVYTGYRRDEISNMIEQLAVYPNIIIKFGRFVPNDKSIFDPVLGVTLASQNQFAERIS